MQYHVNTKTNNPNLCKKESCELAHFKTKEAAKASINKSSRVQKNAPENAPVTDQVKKIEKEAKAKVNNIRSDLSNAAHQIKDKAEHVKESTKETAKKVPNSTPKELVNNLAATVGGVVKTIPRLQFVNKDKKNSGGNPKKQ